VDIKNMMLFKEIMNSLGNDDNPYFLVNNINTDYFLKEGYYEIIDANDNQYSVHVGKDLYIADGQVIKDASGLVRVQGVELPCFMAIRNYPTLSGNTNNEAYLEIESDFENAGSSEAIKHLEK